MIRNESNNNKKIYKRKDFFSIYLFIVFTLDEREEQKNKYREKEQEKSSIIKLFCCYHWYWNLLLCRVCCEILPSFEKKMSHGILKTAFKASFLSSEI